MAEPVKIDFIGGAPGPKGRYPINLLYRPAGVHGSPELYCSPGYTTKVTPKYGKVRGLYSRDNYLYVIIEDTFYRIDLNYTATAIGNVLPGSDELSIDSSETQLMIVDSSGIGYIYTYATNTILQISDADWPLSENCVYCKGHFLFPKKNSNQVFISAIYDGSSIDGTEYINLEARQDYTKAVARLGEGVWVFGEKSVEPLVYTGNADFPFGLQHATIDVGLDAKRSIANGDNALFWLNNHLEVCRSEGLNYVIISPDELTRKFQAFTKTDDAVGWFYNMGGHGFYVLTFPTADKTYVFDVSIDPSQAWSQWSSGISGGRHRANCYTYWKAKNKHIIGDFENGEIGELSLSVYTDDGDTILRERTTPVIELNGKNIRFDELEILGKRGIGDTTTTDPQMMLDWSDDLYGKVWSNEVWASAGAVGQHSWRSRWFNLGMSRGRTFRVRTSDPVEWTFTGAYLKASETKF